jgi:two-component system KDP operon response regulator KdpE
MGPPLQYCFSKWEMINEQVLAVDDEISIQRLLSASLRQTGYQAVLAIYGEQGLQLAEQNPPALIILDIAMPKIDGYEVCRRIREWSQVPIIMLSGKRDETDEVTCLKLGADDYLVKPFGVQELLARVEAVLRRSRPSDLVANEPVFESGKLQIQFPQHLVTMDGKQIKLTPVEFNLLRQLVINRGKVLAHRMLLQQVWGPKYADEREYVQVFVNRLRRKLHDDSEVPHYIRTKPGVGYSFAA